MNKQSHPTLYWVCDYLYMLVFKLIHHSNIIGVPDIFIHEPTLIKGLKFPQGAIASTHADSLSTKPLGTNFNEIWIENAIFFIQEHAVENVPCKMTAILFCLNKLRPDIAWKEICWVGASACGFTLDGRPCTGHGHGWLPRVKYDYWWFSCYINIAWPSWYLKSPATRLFVQQSSMIIDDFHVTLTSHKCHVVSDCQQLHCLFNSLFTLITNKTNCLTGPLCGESTGFPTQRAS